MRRTAGLVALVSASALFALLAVRSGLPSFVSSAACGFVQPDILLRECPPSSPRCEAVVLHDVCIVQEQFILYDAAAAESHADGSGLPLLNVTDLVYYFRHASPLVIEERAGNVPRSQHRSEAVLGHQIPFPPLQIRLAASHELAAAAPTFSTCAVPVVLFASHTMNLGEYTSSVPGLIARLQRLSALSPGVQLALAVPQKLPLEPFNAFLTQPFSRYAPVTLSQLSQRSEGSPACFRTVVLLKALPQRLSPDVPAAAAAVAAYYRPLLPRSPWASTGQVQRVVIEVRCRPFPAYREPVESPWRANRHCATRMGGSLPPPLPGGAVFPQPGEAAMSSPCQGALRTEPSRCAPTPTCASSCACPSCCAPATRRRAWSVGSTPSATTCCWTWRCWRRQTCWWHSTAPAKQTRAPLAPPPFHRHVVRARGHTPFRAAIRAARCEPCGCAGQHFALHPSPSPALSPPCDKTAERTD